MLNIQHKKEPVSRRVLERGCLNRLSVIVGLTCNLVAFPFGTYSVELALHVVLKPDSTPVSVGWNHRRLTDFYSAHILEPRTGVEPATP